MSGRNLRMSNAETLKFLECYRNEPALWSPTNEGYKIKEARAAAAQRIAEALNIMDFTAYHVVIKFNNLRSSYAQELKKIAASEVSGESTYVPTVVWFKLMDAFLRPHVKSRAMLPNLNNPLQETMGIDDIAFQENTDVKSEVESLNEDVFPNSPEHEFCSKPSKSTEKSKLLKRFSLKKRRLQTKQLVKANTSTATGIILNATNRFKKRSERTTFKDDNFDHFGRYIASLLRTLPTQNALMLQQEITTLVVNAHVSILDSSPSILSNFQCKSDIYSSTSDEDTIVDQ